MDDFAREMGLFGGPDGFDAWMKLNTHPTCSKKVNSCAIFRFFICFIFFFFCVCWLRCTFLQQKAKAYSLMQTLASGLNGLLSNFIQGMTKSFAEEGRYEDSEDNVAESNEDEDSEFSSSSN
jgi:hypothetical protein